MRETWVQVDELSSCWTAKHFIPETSRSVPGRAYDLPLDSNKHDVQDWSWTKYPKVPRFYKERRAVQLEKKQKINQALARTGCSHPGFPSPLSIWLKRRLEVWHLLCVNMLCQRAAQAPHPSPLPCPPLHTQPLPALSGPFSWLLC